MFNSENEDIEIVKDFTYHGSDLIQVETATQEVKRKLRLGRAAIEN